MPQKLPEGFIDNAKFVSADKCIEHGLSGIRFTYSYDDTEYYVFVEDERTILRHFWGE